MKGLHTSLIIVIAAIVILIVALIVLTVFGVGMGGVASYLDAGNICCSKFSSTCAVTGSPPADWNVKLTVIKGGNKVSESCDTLTTLTAVAGKTGACDKTCAVKP